MRGNGEKRSRIHTPARAECSCEPVETGIGEMQGNGCLEQKMPEGGSTLVVKAAQKHVPHGVVPRDQPGLSFINPGEMMEDIPGENCSVKGKNDAVNKFEGKREGKGAFPGRRAGFDTWSEKIRN